MPIVDFSLEGKIALITGGSKGNIQGSINAISSARTASSRSLAPELDRRSDRRRASGQQGVFSLCPKRRKGVRFICPKRCQVYLSNENKPDTLLARITRMALTRFQLTDDGILIYQGKTGKKQVKEWTPRLREAITVALAAPSKVPTTYVLHTRSGARYSASGFHSLFYRAKVRAGKKEGIATDFTFHDLKAKGVSDFEGDKRKFSGHATERMVAVYDRKLEKVKTLDLPNIQYPDHSK